MQIYSRVSGFIRFLIGKLFVCHAPNKWPNNGVKNSPGSDPGSGQFLETKVNISLTRREYQIARCVAHGGDKNGAPGSALGWLSDIMMQNPISYVNFSGFKVCAPLSIICVSIMCLSDLGSSVLIYCFMGSRKREFFFAVMVFFCL